MITFIQRYLLLYQAHHKFANTQRFQLSGESKPIFSYLLIHIKYSSFNIHQLLWQYVYFPLTEFTFAYVFFLPLCILLLHKDLENFKYYVGQIYWKHTLAGIEPTNCEVFRSITFPPIYSIEANKWEFCLKTRTTILYSSSVGNTFETIQIHLNCIKTFSVFSVELVRNRGIDHSFVLERAIK